MIPSLQKTLLKEITMNVNNNTIFNSYPRPATLNLAETRVEATASPSWFAPVRAALDVWAKPAAESRGESRLWDIAMSEPSVIATLIQGHPQSDSLALHPESAPAPAAIASKAPKAQGLSVLLERVYQSRQRHNMPITAS